MRREKILSAAWECFLQKGYRETTVREIARRLEASTGVIYTYFKSKDEILEAILARTLEQNRSLFEQAGRGVPSGGAIRELFASRLACCPVDVLIRSARGNIGLWAEALKREHIGRMVGAYLSRLHADIRGFVQGSIEQGALPAGLDPQAVAGFYMAFYLGFELELALVPAMATPEYLQNVQRILHELQWRNPGQHRPVPAGSPSTGGRRRDRGQSPGKAPHKEE
jgi:AcrR family transcriptional regulator